jgi:hypothetical protein
MGSMIVETCELCGCVDGEAHDWVGHQPKELQRALVELGINSAMTPEQAAEVREVAARLMQA